MFELTELLPPLSDNCEHDFSLTGVCCRCGYIDKFHGGMNDSDDWDLYE